MYTKKGRYYPGRKAKAEKGRIEKKRKKKETPPNSIPISS